MSGILSSSLSSFGESHIYLSNVPAWHGDIAFFGTSVTASTVWRLYKSKRERGHDRNSRQYRCDLAIIPSAVVLGSRLLTAN